LRHLTLKGVLLRSEAEPANTPLVEQALEREQGCRAMAVVFEVESAREGVEDGCWSKRPAVEEEGG
jgi:hypothetical protein